jgi:hypothetical protein
VLAPLCTYKMSESKASVEQSSQQIPLDHFNKGPGDAPFT